VKDYNVSSISIEGVAPDEIVVLAYDYIFASAAGTAVAFNATVFDKSATEIGYREISNIPIVRNKLTTIIGKFFTNTAVMTVIVEDNFGGSINEIVIAATSQMRYELMIPKNTKDDTYTFKITGTIAFGAEIKVFDEDESLGPGYAVGATNYTGTINVIIENPCNAAVEIIVPGATVNVVGAVGSITTAVTGPGTLIIAKGSVVTGAVNIVKGNAEILGSIGSLTNPGGGKVFWGVDNISDLRDILQAIPAKLLYRTFNDGVILLQDIIFSGNVVPVCKNYYTIDGRGYSLSGATAPTTSSQGVLNWNGSALTNNNYLTIKDIKIVNRTLTTSQNGTTILRNHGINVSNSSGNIFHNLTVEDCHSGYGVNVNSSTIKATGTLRISGSDVWDLAVAPGSAPPAGAPDPHFDFSKILVGPKFTIQHDPEMYSERYTFPSWW
jgi:hypothetical protein